MNESFQQQEDSSSVSVTCVNLPFFDQLRTCASNIENNVNKLKQLADNEFESGNSGAPAQIMEDINHAKKVDMEFRNSYVETSRLLHAALNEPINLDCIQDEIDRIKNELRHFEDTSGIKDFGYKPFVTKDNPQPSASKSKSFPSIGSALKAKAGNNKHLKNMCISSPAFNLGIPSSSTSTPRSSTPKVHISKILPASIVKNLNGRVEDHRKRGDAVEVTNPINNKRIGANGSVHKVKGKDSTRKYLGRTPQRFEYGITSRRQTIVPERMMNKRYDFPTPEPFRDQTTAIITARNVANFASAQDSPKLDFSTCKFKLNGMKSKEFAHYYEKQQDYQPQVASIKFNPFSQVTPPNASTTDNNGDSFVTVEFTPGMTTHRPKPVARLKGQENNKDKDKVKASEDEERKRFTISNNNPINKVLQSKENEQKITPEQPLSSVPTNDKSVNMLLKSLKKKGTPPRPQSSVNDLHQKLMKQKRFGRN